MDAMLWEMLRLRLVFGIEGSDEHVAFDQSWRDICVSQQPKYKYVQIFWAYFSGIFRLSV